jgi:hypothetical protein
VTICNDLACAIRSTLGIKIASSPTPTRADPGAGTKPSDFIRSPVSAAAGTFLTFIQEHKPTEREQHEIIACGPFKG